MLDDEKLHDFSLFLDVIQTLEAIDAPYMIIGAFAASLFGSTRATYDIDIVVDLTEEHIQQLVVAYPPPRYYAAPYQMRGSIRMGIMFNIIDSSYGDKADLVPLTMEPRYERAFQNRIRQRIYLTETAALDVWCARPEDIIIGKLMAWEEGRSRKHESDIYDVMVFHYSKLDLHMSEVFDERYIDQEAAMISQEAAEFWCRLKTAARQDISEEEQ